MAKTAKDYPISLEYNSTSWPYTRFKKHTGRDYATPVGVPVVIRKTRIGYSGKSGYVFGAHTHMAKWASTIRVFLGFPRKYYDPKDVWQVGGRVVYAGWLGTAGRAVVWKQVRKDGKRVFRAAFHLGAISVKRNDWIK